MQEEQGGYFSKCFLIKTKKRSTHQSLTWASQTAGHQDVELAWGRLCFCISQEHWHRQWDSWESTLPARLLLLCAEQISHVVMGNFILQPGLFFQQTEVPETGEETISTNLHFPSTSGEDSLLFLLPSQAGYTGLYGDSSLAIATQVGPGSASAEVNPCPSPDQTAAAPGLMITSQLCFKVKSSSTPSDQQLLRVSCKCVPVNSGKCEHLGYSNGVKLFSIMPKRWRS